MRIKTKCKVVAFGLALFCHAAFALPPACPDPDKAEAARKAMVADVLPLDNPITISMERQDAILNFLTSEVYKGWCHDINPRDNNIRTTGPIIGFPVDPTTGKPVSKTYATHARVRVYYSNEVIEWLEGGRKGEIPDGAMIIKEMHPYPELVVDGEPRKAAGWTFMLRDRASSHMGWIWGLYYVPGNQTYPIEYLTIQPGFSYCTSCHASTDNSQGTFSFMGNLTNEDQATYVETAPVLIRVKPGELPSSSMPPMGGHGSSARYMEELREMMYMGRPPIPSPRATPNSALLTMLREHLELPTVPVAADIKHLPINSLYDHRVQAGGEAEHFISSDSCSGCHNAANLLNNVPPHGQLPDSEYAAEGFSYLNVTPYGEWQGSMMAMSARDPIFRAQYESEIASLDKKEDKEYVAQFCYSCHAVMGERTNPELAKDPENTYAYPDIGKANHSPEEIEKYEFAALARDGVSCTVCHHIAEKGLGSEETFTAKFNLGPPDKMYGPFDDVKVHSMQQALGITPVKGKQIQDSALCGSCHTIEVPVFDGNQELKGHTFEQDTYMEWVNSSFSKEKGGQTCQECHMPRVDPTFRAASDKNGTKGLGAPNLDIKIANIEDTTFPYVPNRLSGEFLDLESRDNYRRHTLVAANVFGIAMFQQFPFALGSHLFWPGQDPDVVYSKIQSMDETIKQARHSSAKVEIEKVKETKAGIEVTVRINNLAGHKLPSGVGFRRAFIELAARNREGEAVWCSGCTDDLGVIVDGNQQPLPSEFTRDPGGIQQDIEVITTENQVQIYEERNTDCDGQLTTSFIRLCNKVKDNRLLPEGFSMRGPYIEHTRPEGLAGKPTPGYDRVVYRLPKAALATAATLRVILNYQSIPPYYLVDRFSLLDEPGDHPETERLLYMALHLNTDGGTSMQNWKVPMGCYQHALVPLPNLETGECQLPP